MAHEEIALQRIQDGELSVDNDGVIWRHYRFYSFPKGSGTIKYFDPPKKIGYKNKKGYLSFCLVKNKKVYNISNHRVVYLWFNILESFPDNFREINHINGNKIDNSPKNLEFVTRSENKKHACRVLGIQTPCMKGSDNKQSKLDEPKVREIIKLLKNYTSSEIARKYNVNRSIISRIKHNKLWKHIPRDV